MRTLTIADDFRSLLLACRTSARRTGPATIELDRVRGAEHAYDGRLPDELIAAWACVGDPRRTEFCDEDFSPESCVSTIFAWNDFRYLRPTDEPVPLFGTSVRGVYGCLVVPSLVFETRILSGHEPAVTETDLPPQPFARWLQDRYELTAAEVLAARRAPRLEITLLDTPPERISHPTYGSGVVLADAGGFLLASFESGKQRILRTDIGSSSVPTG